MVIFLFVAISYLRKVNKSINVITEYVETKQKLYNELHTEFQGEVEDWNMTIGKDLSIRFNNAQVNFVLGQATLTDAFKNRLDEFIPRYFKILLSDSIRPNISEIRIEGHTDPIPVAAANDPFMGNLVLSQERSKQVFLYIRNMPFYTDSISESQREQLQYWICATGFSYSRTLDSKQQLTFEFKTNPDNDMSRRVEFRVLTNGEKVVERFVKSLEKQ